MELDRFQIYEKNGSKGIKDVLLNRVVVDSKFEVESMFDGEIKFKNGKGMLLKDILRNCDFLNSKYRYYIVEDNSTKLMGLYDSQFKELLIYCNCLKIEYLPIERAFLIQKDSGSRKISYEKLKYLKYHSPKKEEIITLNNLSLYYSGQIKVNSKTGKKVEINR